MKFIKKYHIVFQCCIALIGVVVSTSVNAQDARFTVVLDAGHGGHDPGAMGSFSREKDINLSVELDLGALIEQNFKDVKVVYTRKTDKYLTLQERADVVNDHHADLFICVHTNASTSPAAFGTETFTLGLAKTKANLDVAMRENSVILLEEDYRSKYKGFDPKSVDSYIMFEFMQDKYIDRSVEFSSSIQKQFVSYCGRVDHGVRQAGFWVLHRSACPSVLVEIGFISNPAEERYLTSEQGQKEIASAIYNAFVDYKRTHDKKSGRAGSNPSKLERNTTQERTTPTDETRQTTKPVVAETQKQTEREVARRPTVDTPKKQIQKETTSDDEDEKKPSTIKSGKKTIQATEEQQTELTPVYKVQLFAARSELPTGAPDFKGLENVSFFREGRYYKYTMGEETDSKKIEKIRKEISSKFPDAFIVVFIGDRKLTQKEAQELNR